MRLLMTLGLFLMLAVTGRAGLHTETIDYTHSEAILQGYLAYDDTIQGIRPGVLIVHEWNGLGDYEKTRANELAKLGYIVFALDMYGKGIRPQTPEEASAQAKIYRSNRQLMRDRANAGLQVLKSQKNVDQSRIAAIGYCFGGGTVLELARSGADIAGVVSFHGNLDTPNPGDAENIKAEVLVCQGGADPYVPMKQVDVFWQEMENAHVNWQMNVYGGAVHSFTNPASGNDPSKGAAYNKEADQRSWQAMKDFFDEIFK